MREERFAFLKELVEAPSPSGYESPARAIWRRGVEGAGTTLRTDLHGNTIAAVNPEGTPRIALVGHIDEIGFMVTYIDEDGFVSFASIGGNDPVIAPGQRVRIHTSSGPLLGVIGRRPFHVTHGEDREKKIDFKDLWIDVGTKSREAVVSRV